MEEKESVTSYAKRLKQQIEEDEKKIEEGLEEAKRLNLEEVTFLQSAQSLLDSAKKELEEYLEKESSNEGLKKVVAFRTRAVLDSTFVLETQLVQKDFPDEKQAVVHTLCTTLQELRVWAQTLGKVLEPAETELEVLGVDLVEVLHWRLGALHYMNIATLIKTERQNQLQTQWFEDCVKELDEMLAVRKNTVQFAEDDELSKQGVFSSTHLLAMMYSGEVAYWRHTVLGPSEEFKEKSIELLTRFKKIVETLPAYHGWNESRAVDLLKQLQ